MDINSDSKELSRNVVRLDEAEERMSRQQIREMADVYSLAVEDMDEKKIIHPKMRDKNILNVFREIRTKLIKKIGNKNFTLLVTSISEGGGATFVSTNLAASFALDHGKTALMVDCNIYAPSSDRIIDGPDLGFSDFLQDPSIALEEIIYATGIPRLRFVPAGSATEIGPEYYTSFRMTQFLEELHNRYADRYVILDAPPIGNTADARILSELCDYVTIVVPY
ncbi:MAG: polysaccharide biosynthesis protein, partial [Pseudomonadales bacterium]|nr:polysaccharide biosynthesis protein [Pseudomonadales bacterium]